MKTITIAGKTYKPVIDSTLEHDIWTMRQIKVCGLDEIAIEDGETPEAFAHRVLMTAAQNGSVFELLGGLLMPSALPADQWTPAIAAETGRHFAGVTSPADKAAVRGQITEALMGFFARGLSRLRTSPKSSTSEETKPLPEQSTGELSTMEPGPPSSESLPETIPPECETS